MWKSSALSVCAGLILLAAGARAEEINCTGTLRGSFDNVNVPAGRNCTLIDSHIRGTVYVRGNASLSVRRTVIVGNVQADRCRKGV